MSFHRPEFWVSVSDVPGRSFLLFEWFEPRHTETEKEFAARQKIEQADHVQFFYLEEKLKKDLLINCPPYVIKKPFVEIECSFFKAANYRT
jgi:hypothetical protein